MKKPKIILISSIGIILLASLGYGHCQSRFGEVKEQIITISSEDIQGQNVLNIGNIDGWIYHQGDDSIGSDDLTDYSGWILKKPSDLSVDDADQNGRVEGWFRLKIKLHSDLTGDQLYLEKNSIDASELFIDGQLVKSYGKIGGSKSTTKPYISNVYLPGSIDLKPGVDHVLALHVVDYISMHPSILRSQLTGPNLILGFVGKEYYDERALFWKRNPIYKTIWISVCGLLALFFWYLALKNPFEKNIKLIAFCSSLWLLSLICQITIDLQDISFGYWKAAISLFFFSVFCNLALIPLLVSSILIQSISTWIKYVSATIIVLGVINVLVFFVIFPMALSVIVCYMICLYLVIRHWRKQEGAQWAIVIGILITVLSLITLIGQIIGRQFYDLRISGSSMDVVTTLFYLSFPISMLIFVAMRFQEMINEVREKSNTVLQLADEKRLLLTQQNEILEHQVEVRTKELSKTLHHLKSTQSQLIQSEKMASLGELTAGIAHEIQNPLNFVNNFSEVNKELLEELQEEINNGDMEEVKAITRDLIANEEKINHHGKRADAIVKGMLQHSRTSSGEKIPTDLNELADEYLRLAYHGLRAKDSTFNAAFETELDFDLPKVNVIPQDIGRVLLNLINNAFQAVDEKSKSGIDGYAPKVEVRTNLNSDMVEIVVVDNGSGIPEDIQNKIFQPFFTTKPTGQGTGLGLSLSYDIVKAHDGEMLVNSEEGVGSNFIVKIPLKP